MTLNIVHSTDWANFIVAQWHLHPTRSIKLKRERDVSGRNYQPIRHDKETFPGETSAPCGAGLCVRPSMAPSATV